MQAHFRHFKEFSDLVLFPAGTNLGGGSFADGMIGNPYKWERHGGVDASGVYSGFDDQRVRLGAGYSKHEIYKIRETKNFNPDFSPIGTGSQSDVTDVSDTVPFLRPHDRNVHYVSQMNEFSNDWTSRGRAQRALFRFREPHPEALVGNAHN